MNPYNPYTKSLHAAVVEGKCFRQHLYSFLRAYRSTPQTADYHPEKSSAPRSFHTRLPELADEGKVSDEVRQTDKQNKQKMKQYADRRNQALAT